MGKIFAGFVNFFKRHIHLVQFSTLLFFCFLMLFYKLGNYPLIDVDETRYIGISEEMLKRHNWITPFLNGSPFLEKPPLYFWLNAISFSIFGNFTEFTSRFANAFLAFLAIISTYFFSRKILGSTYALVTSLILLGNIWFLIFSHIAILDMGFMTLSMIAIYLAVYTLFDENEKNKKYLWWCAWAVMALAILMKGFIGIAVPAMVVFLTFLAFRKPKEIFKPIYIFPGLAIFLIIALPWHISIYDVHKEAWVNMYIIKHHFARFANSGMGLGRKHAFLYYIPFILLGLLPWTLSFLATLTSGVRAMIRDIKSVHSIKTVFALDTNDRKILLFASIYFLSSFLFFSISSTKLPSYILVLFPSVALICGYYWYGYVEGGRFERGIKTSTIITGIIILTGGIAGYIIVKFNLIKSLSFEFSLINPFLFKMFLLAAIVPVVAILCLIKKERMTLFFTYVFFACGLNALMTVNIFNFITEFGQNELVEYASKAKTYKNARLATFDFTEKYSVMNEFGDKVEFIEDSDFEQLENFVKRNKRLYEAPVFVIVKNKEFQKYENRLTQHGKIVQEGFKYSLMRFD